MEEIMRRLAAWWGMVRAEVAEAVSEERTTGEGLKNLLGVALAAPVALVVILLTGKGY